MAKELTAREIFMETINFFQGQYPRRNIRLVGSIVSVDGKQLFNIEGYNLLYNLTRLTEALKDELR